MVEDSLQAAMTVWHIPSARLQKANSLCQLFGNLGTGKLPHPGRSQLNAQRHASHQPANFGNLGLQFGREFKIGPRSLGHLYKQRLGVGGLFSLPIGQGANIEGPLRLQV